MKIGGKVGTGFGVVIGAMLLIAAFCAVMLAEFEREWRRLNTVVAVRQEAVLQSSIHLGNATAAFKNYVIHGGGHLETFTREIAATEKRVAQYRATGSLSEEEDAFLKLLTSYFGAYREGMAQVDGLKASKLDIPTVDTAAQLSAEQVSAALASLTQINKEGIERASQRIDNILVSGRAGLLLAVVIAIGVAAVYGFLLVRHVTGALSGSVEVANRVAAGDLSSRIEILRKDETGELAGALKRMNENLSHIVREVRTGAHAIADAVTQLVSGHNDLSRRTEAQSASLEQAAASMEQFTSTVQQNADAARKADKLAQEAAASARQGGEVVAKVVDSMAAINASSKKVSDIIGVIDGIAFQTNILALNAAVEAAHAGDHGRGFAVVASEIRSLAQRSALAAKEIKILIGNAAQSVDQGTELAGQISRSMVSVVAQANQVGALISEISDASKEQATGIAQVNQTVTHLEQMTQQNAALVEEATAATTALEEQARRLTEEVAVFTLQEAVVQDGVRDAPGATPALSSSPAPAVLPACLD